MKRVAAIYLFLLMNVTGDCFATNSLITGDTVGDLVVGKAPPPAKADRLIFRRWEYDENGKQYEAMRIKVAGVAVDVEVYDGNVWRIWIEKSGLVTQDGIEVGASAAAVFQKNLTIEPVIGPGPSLVLIPAQPCGISYVTDAEMTIYAPPSLTRNTVSPMLRNARVNKIIVVGCKVGKSGQQH